MGITGDDNVALAISRHQSLASISYSDKLWWRIPAIRPKLLELDKKQSYKVHERDPVVKLMYHVCEQMVRFIPKWVSPVVLSVPGALMHLLLIIYLLVWGRDFWTYPFFFCAKAITFILDVMDGTHARNTNTQSTARHFWDHSLDIFNAVLSSVIVTILAPPNTLKVVPPTFLLFVALMLFHLGFVAYFATGKMVIVYYVHACNYVYAVFLPLTVTFRGMSILEDLVFQTAFATLCVALQILAAVSFLYYIWYIVDHNRQWHWIFTISVPGPLLVLVVYTCWEYFIGTSLILRLISAFATATYLHRLHAQQLRNAPMHPFTPEFLIFLAVVVGFGFPVFWEQVVFYIILGLMTISWVYFVFKSIREMTEDFPEIGFPIFIITRAREQQSINTKDAHHHKPSGYKPRLVSVSEVTHSSDSSSAASTPMAFNAAPAPAFLFPTSNTSSNYSLSTKQIAKSQVITNVTTNITTITTNGTRALPRRASSLAELNISASVIIPGQMD